MGLQQRASLHTEWMQANPEWVTLGGSVSKGFPYSDSMCIVTLLGTVLALMIFSVLAGQCHCQHGRQQILRQ